MPTNLDRVQTLLQPDTFAKVRTLAKHNRRALSAMSAELVEEALKLPKYKQQIEEADVQFPTKDDPREFVPQTGVTPKTMKIRRTPDVAAKVAEIAMPTTKPRVDHKGYLMKDDYGNVLLEEEFKEKAASQQWKEDYEDLKETKASDDVDARLKKMEEMMAQMAAMMQVKV